MNPYQLLQNILLVPNYHKKTNFLLVEKLSEFLPNVSRFLFFSLDPSNSASISNFLIKLALRKWTPQQQKTVSEIHPDEVTVSKLKDECETGIFLS